MEERDGSEMRKVKQRSTSIMGTGFHLREQADGGESGKVLVSVRRGEEFVDGEIQLRVRREENVGDIMKADEFHNSVFLILPIFPVVPVFIVDESVHLNRESMPQLGGRRGSHVFLILLIFLVCLVVLADRSLRINVVLPPWLGGIQESHVFLVLFVSFVILAFLVDGSLCLSRLGRRRGSITVWCSISAKIGCIATAFSGLDTLWLVDIHLLYICRLCKPKLIVCTRPVKHRHGPLDLRGRIPSRKLIVGLAFLLLVMWRMWIGGEWVLRLTNSRGNIYQVSRGLSHL